MHVYFCITHASSQWRVLTGTADGSAPNGDGISTVAVFEKLFIISVLLFLENL